MRSHETAGNRLETAAIQLLISYPGLVSQGKAPTAKVQCVHCVHCLHHCIHCEADWCLPNWDDLSILSETVRCLLVWSSLDHTGIQVLMSQTAPASQNMSKSWICIHHGIDLRTCHPTRPLYCLLAAWYHEPTKTTKMIPKFPVFAAETSVDAHIFPVQYRCTYPYIYIYIWIYIYISLHAQYICMYIYIIICVCGTPKKPTFLRSQRFWDKIPCSVWVSVRGTIYIYIYTYVCINCCLTVEPRYLEQFCHQKRLQTFANESRGPST